MNRKVILELRILDKFDYSNYRKRIDLGNEKQLVDAFIVLKKYGLDLKKIVSLIEAEEMNMVKQNINA